jgi:protoporphyrinogen IX oxidase
MACGELPVIGFLLLHMGALLVWIATVLYLSTLIARPEGIEPPDRGPDGHADSLARFVFTRIATPAALLAIIAGSAVFLINRTTDPWLIIKLTLVAGLVICHTLLGLLARRAEAGPVVRLQGKCRVLAGLICVLMVGIIWLVLAKPDPALLPW